MNKIYLLLIPILLFSACAQQVATTTTVTVPEVKIIIESYDENVKTDQEFAITWRIEGPEKSIDHTAIHYGLQPKPDAKVPSDYSKASQIQAGTVPATYSTIMTINEPGTYYFR